MQPLLPLALIALTAPMALASPASAQAIVTPLTSIEIATSTSGIDDPLAPDLGFGFAPHHRCATQHGGTTGNEPRVPNLNSRTNASRAAM
jgi:hypothetical protein